MKRICEYIFSGALLCSLLVLLGATLAVDYTEGTHKGDGSGITGLTAGQIPSLSATYLLLAATNSFEGTNDNRALTKSGIVTFSARPSFTGGGAVVAGGKSTLSAGKVTISTAFAHLTNAIVVSELDTNILNVCSISNVVNDTSFQIISNDANATNIVFWMIFKP